MRKVLFLSVIGFIIAFSFSFVVFATSEKDIVFPVAELGNCKNKQECKAYCGERANVNACLAFAKKHNLLSEKDAKKAEKLTALPPEGGPGGCVSFEECASYCGTVDHIQECLAFGKKHGLMEGKELEEAEKVEKALHEGTKLPGGCTSKEQCEAYCNAKDHMMECIEFAHQAGFMSDEEYKMAKKTGGKGPGGCKGRECKDYCENPDNFEKCIEFAKEQEMISDKEYQMAKKTGGKGPGGCRGEECHAYCQAHQEECMQWAKKQGLIPEDQLRQMEEFKQQMPSPEGFQRMRKEHEGGAFPPPADGKPEGFRGPAGCQTPEECQAYCSDPTHYQECGITIPKVPTPPSGQFHPPSEFQPQPSQPQSGLQRFGATLIHTLQFLMRR